jgi:hypothetical protein
MQRYRKIIQIALLPASEKSAPAIYALCSDGSLFARVLGREGNWERLENVPPKSLDGVAVDQQIVEAEAIADPVERERRLAEIGWALDEWTEA